MAGFFEALGQGFAAHAERQSRRDQIVTLNAKTDAELKALGLSRADIPFHVYRDILYV